MKDKINEVIRRIQYLLPEVEVVLQRVSKNNDVIKMGVMLKSKDNNIAPVFYLDDMMEQGWSYDRIAMDICRSYQEHDGAEYSSVNLATYQSDNERIFISGYSVCTILRGFGSHCVD